jgi:hypothetical protein
VPRPVRLAPVGALVAAGIDDLVGLLVQQRVQGVLDRLPYELSEILLQLCLVTDNRYGVCPSLLRDQRTILTVVGTARWLVFSLTPQGCLLLESPRAVPVTRGPAMT